MDVANVPITKTSTVKPWTRVRTSLLNTLDSAAPYCAPLATRWDAEKERRTNLRTPQNLKALIAAQRDYASASTTHAQAKTLREAARANTSNPLSTSRRAARTSHKAASKHKRQARDELRQARKNYPTKLTTLATQVHLGHSTLAGIATWALHSPWPAATSGLLVAANAVPIWVGRRAPRTDTASEGMTAEEKRLAGRLDPTWWTSNADARGLDGTVPTKPVLTEAGLISHVRLDARWTPKTFKAKRDEIRALLGARTDLLIDIKPGSHGDRATLTLRTRSAADGISLNGWKPGDPWGVDTITGEAIPVPLGRRMLVAGTSGAGKSWSTRAILAEGSEYDDHRLVVIDMKQVEARNWEHRARTAVTPDDILDVTDELVAEMHDRLSLIPRGKDVVEISPERPRITVFVDEGGELIAASKLKADDKEGPNYKEIIENLRTLARMARAAEIILVWATQKPTMSGDGHGIDSQIAGQITYRASLALSSATESQVVFGTDAHEKGWHAHELPMPGFALLRSSPKAAPNPVKTRAFSPQDVINLPDRPIWKRSSQRGWPQAPQSNEAAQTLPTVVLAKEDLTESETIVYETVLSEQPVQQKDVVAAAGVSKGTVSKAVAKLVAAGLLLRTDAGLQAVEAV